MPMDKQLYIAIKKGDKKVVEEYKEPFATQLTANKNTVLHVAAESRLFSWEDSADFLAMVGWDLLFSLNSNGNTCIHLAARVHHFHAIKAIIDYMNQHELPEKFGDIEAGNNEGASALLRMTNNEGKSALYVAVEKGKIDAVKYILNECNSPSYAGPYGTTALHAAVMSHSEFCVELLLKKKPSLTKQADNFGWNPLHYAACYSNSEAIVRKLLLADKEMAYETIKENNMTPLHIAAIRGRLEGMKEIVEQCPDSLDAVTSQGQNVLHLVYSNMEIIDFLEEQGICRSQEMIDFLKEKLWLYNFTEQRDADGNFPNCATREQTVLSHPLLKLRSVKDFKEKLEKREKEFKEREEKRKNKSKAEWKEKSNTHLIVATLILTVSFAAGFTVPGGFRSSDGPKEGMAILGKKAAFKAFAITDTIAMIASSAAVFLLYHASLRLKLEKKKIHYAVAAFLVFFSMVAMMIVFMTGLYVMQPSTSLAVFICVSCSLSLIFFIFIFCNVK